MSPQPSLPRARDRLMACFQSGNIMRSRSVSEIVLTRVLDVPMPPARLLADWEREISQRLMLEPGDVEALPLARTRARWPDYSRCVQAMAGWTDALGMPGLLGASEIALMACRGARYHHDGMQYGDAAFCNLFLSEDKGLDVHFPVSGQRIALTRGTALLFDTGQPHAVVPRGASRFDAADFPAVRDCSQLFLTWELAIEHAGVARALDIGFDIAGPAALPVHEAQVLLDGMPADVCPHTGWWRTAGSA